MEIYGHIFFFFFWEGKRIEEGLLRGERVKSRVILKSDEKNNIVTKIQRKVTKKIISVTKIQRDVTFL
jgi:hypothetical protein